MILTREKIGAADAGMGDDVTIDALLRRHASKTPDDCALVDPVDRPVFTDGRLRRLSWAELDAEVERVSAGLRGLNLGRDTIVALQMPNIVEGAIAFLAVLRAGYIPMPVPLAWRRREVTQALIRTSAKAIVTVCRCGPVNCAELACYAAADAFTIRFVLAFGRNAPDGVISIDENIGELARPSADADLGRPGKAGHHVALVTWDATPSGFAPVVRTQGELVTSGLSHMLEAGLSDEDVIATTLLGSSIAGLATGFVSSLISGATLVLHQPFSSRALAGAMVTEGISHLIIPGPAALGMASLTRSSGRQLRSIGAVWRTGDTPGRLPVPSAVPVVDVMTFGEVGIASAARGANGIAADLPHGKVHSPRSHSRGPSLLETRVTAQGYLTLRGALVPSANLPGEPSLSIDMDGWVDTGLMSGVAHDVVRIGSSRRNVARIGGLSFPRPALEESLRMISSSAGAALALQRDNLFGEATRAGNGNQQALAEAFEEAGASSALLPRTDETKTEQRRAGAA